MCLGRIMKSALQRILTLILMMALEVLQRQHAVNTSWELSLVLAEITVELGLRQSQKLKVALWPLASSLVFKYANPNNNMCNCFIVKM